MKKNQRLRFSAWMFAAAAFTGLVGLAGCAATATQSSTGQYLDDAAITARVKTAIFNDPTLKVTEINVETHQGVVQLSGFVSTVTDVRRAQYLAQSVNGVRSVINDMRLK